MRSKRRGSQGNSTWPRKRHSRAWNVGEIRETLLQKISHGGSVVSLAVLRVFVINKGNLVSLPALQFYTSWEIITGLQDLTSFIPLPNITHLLLAKCQAGDEVSSREDRPPYEASTQRKINAKQTVWSRDNELSTLRQSQMDKTEKDGVVCMGRLGRTLARS